MEESEDGFRKAMSTQDPIFILRQIEKKLLRRGKVSHICFIDLKKALDRIRRNDIWNCMKQRGVETNSYNNSYQVPI